MTGKSKSSMAFAVEEYSPTERMKEMGVFLCERQVPMAW